MAEPFLLRPWELANLTDKQIRLMIAGQQKATESVKPKDDDGPKAFDEPATEIGNGDYVSPEEAKAFFGRVDEIIYQ